VTDARDERKEAEKETPPAEDLGQVLDVISEKAPGILAAIRDAVFSEEAGRSFGKAVGAFYKELVDAGIPAEEAVKMSRNYIVSLEKAMSQMQPGGGHRGLNVRIKRDDYCGGQAAGAGEDE